jgi:hypothetical protein
MSAINFTTPVGRLLMGSLYNAQTTDAEGKPLVIKYGQNAGQPKVQYFFAVGIPKGSEQHWSQTDWGQKIWSVGHTAFPNVAASPHFAWKIVDGDSNVPNRNGKKPCDREGYPGHWVLSFTSGFAPKIYNRDGAQAIVELDAVKLGYYVQVNGTVDGNGSVQQPGIYLNHNMVALSAYGPEIVVGPDASTVGFGVAPLPPGAMAAPVGGFAPQAPAVVTPNPAFLAIPPAPVMPPLPPTPPVQAPPRVPQPTAKANGASYEQLINAGWTPEQLVAHGMVV